MLKQQALIFIFSIIFCTNVFSMQDEDSVLVSKPHNFKLAIAGVYASTARKLTLDGGLYWVLDRQRKMDSSSIMGPTLSGAISKNSASASLGFGKISSVSMIGAYGAQIDYSYLRLWQQNNQHSFTDYSGVELKCSVMVFVFKASFMKARSSDDNLNYLSIGIGF